MEAKTTITFWVSEDGRISAQKELESLITQNYELANITNKLAMYSLVTTSELKSLGRLEKIKGRNDYSLSELRIKSSPPIRFLVKVFENSIIVLVSFKGSGSNGRVSKFVEKAEFRIIY